MGKAKVKLSVYAIVTLSIFILLLLETYLINFLLDDVYISARFAENLINGHGLVYNIGERVEGYSNLSWVLLIAAGFKLGVSRDPMTVAWFTKIIGAMFSVATVLMIARFSFRLAREEGRTPSLVDTIAVLFISTSFSYALWAVGGLETPLYIFLLVCAGYFYVFDEIRLSSDANKRGFPLSLSSLFFALMGFTRPEFFILFGAASIHRIWINRSSKEPLRRLIRWFLPVIVVSGAYLLWRHSYYGYWLPNTVYAKSNGGIKQYFNGGRYLLKALAMSGIATISFIGLVPLFLKKTKAWYSFILMIIVAQSMFIVASGGDWMYGFRMITPIIPFIALCIQEGVRLIANALSQMNALNFRRTSAILVITTLFVITALTYSSKDYLGKVFPGWHSITGNGVNFSMGRYYKVGLWMKDNIPPDSLVATGEGGIIPYTAGFRLLDCYGLMDTHLGHLPGELHKKFDIEYLLERKPDYLVFPVEVDHKGNYHSKFDYNDYVISFLTDERIKENYELMDVSEQFDRILLYKRKTIE